MKTIYSIIVNFIQKITEIFVHAIKCKYTPVNVRKKLPITVWKVSKYGIISDPHFPVFGLNADIY